MTPPDVRALVKTEARRRYADDRVGRAAQHIEAIYEAGILKPLAPLPELADKSRVRVTIEPAGKPAPKVRRSPYGATDYSRLRDWLRQNRDKYRGHWVVLVWMRWL
jgi:predicted DNA-binding antitoxin AbrB/MazE fold protein